MIFKKCFPITQCGWGTLTKMAKVRSGGYSCPSLVLFDEKMLIKTWVEQRKATFRKVTKLPTPQEW